MAWKHSAWVTPLAWAVVLAGVGLGQAAYGYDDVLKPIRPLGAQSRQAAVPVPKPSPATMEQSVQTELAAQFQQASGARRTLTAQQARTAGWGFIADHFSEIDTSRKGYVTLAEISRFMAQRSPQRLMQDAVPQ